MDKQALISTAIDRLQKLGYSEIIGPRESIREPAYSVDLIKHAIEIGPRPMDSVDISNGDGLLMRVAIEADGTWTRRLSRDKGQTWGNPTPLSTDLVAMVTPTLLIHTACKLGLQYPTGCKGPTFGL